MAAKPASAKTAPQAAAPALSALTSTTGARGEFDRLIHERSRLAIVSALAVNKTLSFNDLKSVLAISDGNLSSHARKLEDAGYILCEKRFENRLPNTCYSLTGTGRKALKHYISHMESLIAAVKHS
ncbi:MAG: transcriptional regulator [Pseudomonadales bacterium]|nr:transcriptional regulator [Pseudomonadales bacterium]MCP5330021.1 transcriptional regulator [Pseudomonadales bacterium]MCP5343070.1 transcriptional regulator [Pseudomonadales bacterium]